MPRTTCAIRRACVAQARQGRTFVWAETDISIILGIGGMSLCLSGSNTEIWHVDLAEIRSWHHGGADPQKPNDFAMTVLWDSEKPTKLHFRTSRVCTPWCL